MRVPFCPGTRPDGASIICKLSGVSHIHHLNICRPMARHISWMPFELPDPSLYPRPPSLQPKRPVPAEVVSSAGDTVLQTTMIGRVGTTLSTARTQETPISGKPVSPSVPASATKTGPTPLSQIQKRTLATVTQPRRHAGSETVVRQSTAPTKNSNGVPIPY